MKKFQMLAGCVAAIACGELGCETRAFEPVGADDAASFLELPDQKVPDEKEDSNISQDAGKDAKAVQIGKRGQPPTKGSVWGGLHAQDADIQDSGDLPDNEDTSAVEINEEDLPNAILIITCESEPSEVAIPYPTRGEHSCERIHAIAYRADDSGAYEVSADYSWEIQNEQIAFFAPELSSEHSSVQFPIAQRDIFYQDGLEQEPETEFMVCAEPHGGWPPGYGPVCRSLLIRAVVNMASPWCFSGATFQSDCDFIGIGQDGRQLTIESDGQGSILGRKVSFNLNGLLYQAELNDPEYMQGTVTDLITQESLGNWSAYKYTM